MAGSLLLSLIIVLDVGFHLHPPKRNLNCQVFGVQFRHFHSSIPHGISVFERICSDVPS